MRVALVLAALVIPMAITAPPAGAAARFPLPSAAGIRSGLESTWAFLTGYQQPSPRVPVQASGTAAGHPHEVAAALTRAGRGTGRAPGKGAGQLPAYRVLPRKVLAGLSGRAVTGFDARTSRFVPAQSTATMDVYQNADGSFTRRYAAAPVNFRNAAGAWQPIVTTLVPQAGGRWGQQANSAGVSFAPSGASPDLTTVAPAAGESVSTSLSGAATVSPVVSGSTITYPAVLAGTDLVASSTAVGAQQSLVLHSALAASSWVYPLDLHGLQAVPAAGGAIDLMAPDGKAVAFIPAGYAHDSDVAPPSGVQAATDAVSYQLVSYQGATALQVTLDQAWLHDPARVFPVTVSVATVRVAAPGSAAPQVLAQAASRGTATPATSFNGVSRGVTTYAESQVPGDHSSEQTMSIGSYDSGTHKANSFLQFPGLGLDGSKITVASASLSLSVLYASTCTAERFDVYPVTQPWTPSGVTAYPGPTYGASIGNFTPSVPNACANTSVDVTKQPDPASVPLSAATVQAWANGTTADYGLAISAATSDSLHWKQFGSDSYSPGPPVLTVTYTAGVLLPGVISQFPADQTVENTLTPTLLASGTDDSSVAKLLYFDFQVYNSAGAKIADSGSVKQLQGACCQGVAEWAVPSGDLKWGTQYYWTVQAYDGTNYSSGPVWYSMSIQVPQPAVTSLLSQNSGGHGFDPSVGNYTTSATDASVATVGPSLSVVRDYNSLDPRTTGAFGAAWSSVFDVQAHALSGSVNVTYPDGSVVGFGKNSDGSYTAPSGRFATLTAVTGGFTLTDKNDTVYTFTQALGSSYYGITSIADSNARAVTFTWTTASPWEITAMTSAVSGRALHLTWSTPSAPAHPHVTAVATDPVTSIGTTTPLTWAYGYTGDQLTSVCPPNANGKCTAYAYQSSPAQGSDFHSAMLDESPQSFWPLSETSGTTAASAALANAGTDNATYHNVTLGVASPVAGATTTAASFNGTTSYVQLPNLQFEGTYNESVSLWFKTSTAGGTLLSQDTNPIAATDATNQDFRPVLYVGTDHKLHGAFWQGGTITLDTSSAVVDDGSWHHAVLTASPSGQQLYVDGAAVGTPAPGASTVFPQQVYPYDMVHYYLGTGFNGDLFPNEKNYTTTPSTPLPGADYFSGSIADFAYFNRTLTPQDITTIYGTGTTPASLLSKITQPSGDQYAAVAYDPNTTRVKTVTDENGGTWTLGAPVSSGSSEVYRSSVLGAEPQDYWRLGDGAGAATAANEVHAGTAAYSTVTLGQAGPFADETAAAFNGSSSYVSLPSGDRETANGAAVPAAVGLWFKTTGSSEVLYSSQNQPVTGSTAPSSYTPALYVGKDGYLKATFWVNDLSSIMTSKTVVNDGKWHYAVLSTNGAALGFFLDGQDEGYVPKALVIKTEPYVAVGSGWLGGSWPDTASTTLAPRWFTGSIGEVAWYNLNLSAATVAAQWNASRNSGGLAPVVTVQVTDPGTRTLSYEYDPRNGNRQVATIDALGHKTTYGYDSGGFLYTVTDPDGNVTTTGHDPRGNVVSITTCQVQATDQCSTVYKTYYPDDTSAQLTAADPLNDQVLTVRDGRSASATDTTYETSYTYDSAGDLFAVTTPPVPGSPSGRETAVAYSDGSSNYPATPAPGTTDTGNVPAGLPVVVVAPDGAEQFIGYDHLGDVTKTTNADGLVTSYTYDELGRVLSKTETSPHSYPGGLTTTYVYDGESRVVTQTDPTVTDSAVTGAAHQAQTTTVYDPDGNIQSQTVADLSGGDTTRIVQYAYNSLGQVQSQTDAAGALTSYTYDAYGNKATETDADQNETQYGYDPNGNLTSTTLLNYTGDPVSPSAPVNLPEESRAYDPAGRLQSVTGAMGNITSYTYTDNGLLATVTRTDRTGADVYVQESDSYDAAGNLIHKVTNNGATTSNYTVDAANRVTATTEDPTGADRVTLTSYTPDDKPATVTRTSAAGATQVTSYTYDAMGNMTSQSVQSDGSGHPAGWWQLNHASGTTVTDSSGTGNTASATGGVTWSGGAAQFSGAAGPQVATNGPVLNTAASYSVSAWVNLANITGWQTIVGQDGTTSSAFYLQLNAHNQEWNFARAETDATGPVITRASASTAAAAGTWYHLVGTFDSSTGAMDLYVNGALAGTAADTSMWTSSGPLTIGRGLTSGSQTNWVSGLIENVQVYQRVLSAADVSALYAGGRGGGTTASSAAVTTKWTLDERGLPASMTDPMGNVTTYRYDEAGHEAQVTAPAVAAEKGGQSPVTANPVTDYGYDTFGDQVEVRDPDGNLTTYGYDGDSHVTSETLPPYTPPGGKVSITAPTLYDYDGNGNLKDQTDPLGNETSYVYDQMGDLATVTTPGTDGGTTHYLYFNDGQPATVTGPTGAQAQATYDFMGREQTSTVLERYPSAAALTTYYYYTASAADPGGAWLSSVTSPQPVTTTYGYDSLGEQTSVTDGASDVTSTAYDFLGRPASVTAPTGTQQVTSYDAVGDPVQVQEAKAGTVLATRSATYDSDGNMRSATDANQHTATFTYGPTGLLATESQPVSASASVNTSFGYDLVGNQTRYTDGRQGNWITGYNSWNLPETQAEPDTSAYTSSTFTMAYDADGRPATYTEPGLVTLTYNYDAQGRLTSESGTGADAPTATRGFGYDQAGNMQSATTTAAGAAPATSETFTYNDRGELLTASGAAGSTTLGYNNDGLLSTRTDAAGTTSYSYDNADRLSGLTDPATGASLTYGYTSDQLTSVSYGSGGDTRRYGYDGLGRLTSDTLTAPGGPTLASITYGYDPNGNLTSKATTGLAGAAANTYGYDWANRLTSWNNGTTATAYGYDANGNRTSVGPASYTYDARDQLTSDGTSSYSYTARGTLSATTSSTATTTATADAYGQQLTDGPQSYAFDALGRMLTATPASGTATTLSYSGASSLLASDGTSTYTWTPGGSLTGIGVAGGSASSGVLAMTDQHTDVIAGFTPAGTALSGSVAYDPLGNVIATSGAVPGHLGYQSAFTDPVTSKSLMGARWYNPATGQFTSRDTASNSPVPNSADANPFAYAAGNPMTGIDPTGHNWWSSVTSWASSTWDAGTSWLSDAWDTGTSWLSNTWDRGWNWGASAIRKLNAETDAIIAAANREEERLDQEVRDSLAEAYALEHMATRALHRVVHAARKVLPKAVSLMRTGYHELKQVAKSGAAWVEHHKAAIASIAAGAATFIGCEALTAPETLGASTVGCAAAAGAVGNLVSYDISCGSSAGGCSVAGALVSAGVGAIAGAAGGALTAGLGGELASSLLDGALPSIAREGLVGMVSGAGAGAVGGAAGYGAQCAQGGSCSWSGLGGAVASGTVSGAIGGAVGGTVGGGIRALRGSGAPAEASGDPAATDEEARSPSCSAALGGQSFTAGTLVLLASGKAVPISSLKKGDKVKAVDTKTGKPQVKDVAAVLVHYDTDLYDLTVQSGGHTEVIHTTSSHLFWDPYLKQWVTASKLKKGEHLKTPDGTIATADGGDVPADHDGWMWDLTVNDDHDFFVLPADGGVGEDGRYYYVDGEGATAILAHNCSTGVDASGNPCKCADGPNAYSAAFEMTLDPADWGRARPVHFNRANAALDAAINSDPAFAQDMENLIPGVANDVSSAGGRRTPDGWTWQHEPSSNAGGRFGVMRLVPRFQHDPGSVWQSIIHPGGAGGYAEWAIPNGAPPNLS